MQLRGHGGLLSDWSYWLDRNPRPGALNMAIDRALLDLADREGLAVLRIYRWSPHCLSFGRNEPARRRYDRDAIRRMGLSVVRRPTGGRAVWHAGELTYAVAAPSPRLGSLAEAYRTIHRTLAHAITSLGIPADLAGDAATPPLDAGACFARPVGGEVMVGNRKVAGSAQLRLGGAMLQHGSLLLNDDQSVVAALSLGGAQPGQESALNSLLPRPVSFETAAAAFERAAAADWPGTWTRLADPRAILDAAEPYRVEFDADAWIWRR